MTATEKHIWQALRRHVQRDHTLRVRLVGEASNDLEIECIFCGHVIMAGSPALVNHIGQQLVDSGVRVVRPSTQPQVRLQ